MLLTILLTISAYAGTCEKPWMLFDTGQTLIVTPPDYKNMHNEPGMEDYLNSLADEGFPMGLVINVPEDWGDDQPVKDKMTGKYLYTRSFIEDGWQAGTNPFPWDHFGRVVGEGENRKLKGRIFFPVKNSDRKPEICPTCVLNVAVAAAKAAGCAAVYQGEDTDEIEAAEKVGLIPFQVGKTDPSSFYLKADKVLDYVNGYKPGGWKSGSETR